MGGFLKSMFSGIPLGCVVVGAGLSVLLGSFWWGFLGLFAAAGIAAPRHLSSSRKLLSKVAAGNAKRLEDLNSLSSEISSVQGVPGAEQFALQVRDQFDGANGKYVNFRTLLSSKFAPTELTFARYMKSADQVHLSMLDGIQNATTILTGLRTIDIDQIRAQVRQLKRADAPDDAQVKELQTLEHRLQLREDELASLRELLSTNEQSMTTLTMAGTALTKLQTSANRTALDADTAMRELEELAERAQNYSIAAPSTRKD
jgi:hypothetical protein